MATIAHLVGRNNALTQFTAIDAMQSIAKDLERLSVSRDILANDVLRQVQLANAAREAISTDFASSIQKSLQLGHAANEGLLSQVKASLIASQAIREDFARSIASAMSLKDVFTNNVLQSVKAAALARVAMKKDVLASVQSALSLRDSLTTSLAKGVEVADALSKVREQLAVIDFAKVHSQLQTLIDGQAIDLGLPVELTDDEVEVAKEIQTELLAQGELSVEEKISWLFEWAQKQDSGRIRLFIADLIKDLLVGLLFFVAGTMVSQYQVQTDSTARPREVVREVRIYIRQLPVKPFDINERRIVARRKLVARSRPRRKSQRVGRIKLGTIVTLLEKRGKWAHVSWTDVDTNEKLEGWIAAKNLKRIQ